MTVAYTTRGTFLPEKSPSKSGTGVRQTESVADALNNGKRAAFDYGLLYEDDDPVIRTMQLMKKSINDAMPDSMYEQRRSVIARSDGIELIFDNFPTRREHANDPRDIRSCLYFKFGRDELTEGDVECLTTLFADSSLTGVMKIVDSFIPDNDALVEFRALPTHEKSNWLRQHFFAELSEKKHINCANDVNRAEIIDLLSGKAYGCVFAEGERFVRKSNANRSDSNKMHTLCGQKIVNPTAAYVSPIVPTSQTWIDKVRSWFEALPMWRKLVLIIVGAVIFFLITTFPCMR